ncbi:MAG: hypothetical protein ABI777_06800 [Betaproteobacteria bacterium]
MQRTKVIVFALLSGTATLAHTQVSGTAGPTGAYTPNPTSNFAEQKSFFESRSNTARGNTANPANAVPTPGSSAQSPKSQNVGSGKVTVGVVPGTAPSGAEQKSFFESRSNTAKTPVGQASTPSTGATQKSFFESRSNTARTDTAKPAKADPSSGSNKVSRTPSLPVDSAKSATAPNQGSATAPAKILQ